MKNLIHRISILLTLLVIPNLVQAQTVTKTIAGDFNDSLTNVNGYTHSLKIDAAAPVSFAPACVVNGTAVTCTGPINLASGSHTIIWTVANAGGSASGTLNYVPPPGPASPTNIKIIVNITIP